MIAFFVSMQSLALNTFMILKSDKPSFDNKVLIVFMFIIQSLILLNLLLQISLVILDLDPLTRKVQSKLFVTLKEGIDYRQLDSLFRHRWWMVQCQITIRLILNLLYLHLPSLLFWRLMLIDSQNICRLRTIICSRWGNLLSNILILLKLMSHLIFFKIRGAFYRCNKILALTNFLLIGNRLFPVIMATF